MSLTATIDLRISSTEKYTGPGPNEIGTNTIQKLIKATYANATLAYAARATLKAAAAVATFVLPAGTASTSTAAAGAKQVETFTALGNITQTGNLAVTVTGAGIAGSPLAINVAVVTGDTPAVWGGKVRAALAATAAVTALYDVGGANAVVTLTRKIEAANDATFEVAAAAGTAANASLPITSANTTPGVAAAGTVLSGTVGGEIRGTAIDPATGFYLVVIVAEGTGVSLAGPVTGALGAGSFLMVGATGAADFAGDWLVDDLVATSVDGAGAVDVLVFALN